MLATNLRRHWVACILNVALVGVLLAGCAPSPAAPTATSAPTVAAPSPAAPTATSVPTPMVPPPLADLKLTIALSSDINTLDPHKTASVGTDHSVISHLYSSLVIRGPDLKLYPNAAESWEVVNDTTWRFKLRPGITYPNGEKLDANTVKWNIERVLNPEVNARIKSWFDPISEVRVIDDTTVEIITKTPYAVLADQLSMLWLLAPKWAAEHNPAAEAMGTGPYNLVEWVKDDHVTLEAKADYWGEKPLWKTVIFRPVPEASSRISGLLAGDYDIIKGFPPADLERINASGRAVAGSVPSTRSALIKLNTFKEPINDVRVRKALNYAVDKDSLIKNLLNNSTVKSNGQVMTEHYFGYNPGLQPYPYDPEKAKQLLAEAGFADGLELEFDVPTGTYVLGEQIVQAIAEQLRQVGITAKVTEMPFSVYMDKYLKEKNLAQMAYITYAWPTLDADGILSLFETGNQYAYWDNEEFTNALKEGRSTTDPEKRRAAYKKATQIMYDEAVVVFLFPQPAVYAVANHIDWKDRGDDWVRAFDVKLKK